MIIFLAFVILLAITSPCRGEEPIDIGIDYTYGERNGETFKNKGGIDVNYDSSINDSLSVWTYANIGYDSMVNVPFETFAGGGLKYNVSNDLSFSTGVLGHYIDTQWDFLYSHRIKVEIWRVYGVGFYQHEVDDWSDYITKGKVGYKIDKYLSMYHKRERRDTYRDIYNGLSITFKIGD